jgi:penicillin-binding protein 1A
MTEIHEGLPVESLGSFAFDAGTAVPQVVNTGSDGAVDPLAAALSEALGQPQPQPTAPAETDQPQATDPAQLQPQAGRTLPDPGVQTGAPPQFPAETSSTAGLGEDTEMTPDNDPLTQALRGIEGVYKQ